MEFWEFLLQKEGDRTWLPLEAAKVEILEGRYRVMAHSSHTNNPVEIRVTQMLLEDTPPKRRILKRASQTNHDGLMVVMPFTRLQPGAWELQCIHQDDANNGWRYSVQLQVLSQEDETSGEWHPSWEDAGEDAAANTSPGSRASGEASEQAPGQRSQSSPPASVLDGLLKTAAVSAISSSEAADNGQMQNFSEAPQKTPLHEEVTEALKLADQLSRQIVDSVFKEIEKEIGHALADSSLNISTEPASTPPAEEFTSAPIPACEIALSQSAFMVQQRCPLAIVGQIGFDSTSTISEISDAKLPASELRIHLRDPDNSEVLLEQTYPLQNTGLPADFRLDLALPSPLPTRLMLGEITLHFLHPNAPAAAWASQTFTITAPINELLEAIANEAEGQSESGYVSLSPETEQSPDDAQASQTDETAPFIPHDFPLPAPKGANKIFQPLSKQPLPPKLYQPAPDLAAARPLILPKFPTSSPPLKADSPQSADQSCSTDNQPLNQAPAESSAGGLGTPEESALANNSNHDLPQEPDELAASQLESAPFELDAELAAATIQAMGEEAVDPVARSMLPSVDNAFRALNLQQRFWSRLSALTAEGNKEAAEFRAAVEAAGVRMSAADTAAEKLDAEDVWFDQTLAMGGAINSDQQLAEEIVVYEEPIEAAPIQSLTDHAASESVEAGSGSVDNDAETVTPTPVLKIPAVELTAGDVISINVSLPTLETRTYVKLWMSDRQTRALLVEPRWLMDLQANGNGELLTSLRLTVPLGCTEIRFTAIAINMLTQQESYKAIVDRTVFPPNLPPLLLEEFEV